MLLITVDNVGRLGMKFFLILVCTGIIFSGCANNKKNISSEEIVTNECELSHQSSKQCEILNSKNLTNSDKEVTLGLLYLFGNNEVEKNYEKAFLLLSKYSKGNNPEALNGLGIMYLYGLGIKQDFEFANKYFEKANVLGDKVAKINLGELYRQKNDLNTSKYWYERAIVDNPSKAHEGLSKIYLDQKNYEKAFFHAKEAAQLGNTESEYNLGVFYENGIYIKKNLNEARVWYLKAAEKGHLDAKHNLKNLKNNPEL